MKERTVVATGRFARSYSGHPLLIGSALYYATRYPARAAYALATDPLAIWDTLRERLVQAREYRDGPCRYASTPEKELHRAIDVAWPCPCGLEFRRAWPRVVESVRAAGVNVGPESFNGYNDGDEALARAVSCLTRHLEPDKVVETGVAHGFTSLFVLEALTRNGRGGLWSIDRPPLDPAMRRRIGIAVKDRSRWSLIAGSSRRRMPRLLVRLGEIGLFIHDSMHTEQNVRFELDRAWRHLAPGGAMIVDDIDTNWAFRSFIQNNPIHRSFVCESEPVRPDERRFNGRGLFGIILKGIDESGVRSR